MTSVDRINKTGQLSAGKNALRFRVVRLRALNAVQDRYGLGVVTPRCRLA